MILTQSRCAGSYLIVYIYQITMSEPRIQLAFRNKKKITIDKEHVFCDLSRSTFFFFQPLKATNLDE